MPRHRSDEYIIEEEDRGDVIVRRAARLPKKEKHHAASVVNSIFWLLVLAIILAGMLLAIIYKDALLPRLGVAVNQPPDSETPDEPYPEAQPPVPSSTTPAVIKTEKEDKNAEIQTALTAVLERQLDAYFPLTNQHRELIQKHWKHVIEGCTPEEELRFLDLLDMCYDDLGVVRNMTFKEMAIAAKKRENRKGVLPAITPSSRTPETPKTEKEKEKLEKEAIAFQDETPEQTVAPTEEKPVTEKE